MVLHKTFWGTAKKCKNKKLFFSLRLGAEREGLRIGPCRNYLNMFFPAGSWPIKSFHRDLRRFESMSWTITKIDGKRCLVRYFVTWDWLLKIKLEKLSWKESLLVNIFAHLRVSYIESLRNLISNIVMIFCILLITRIDWNLLNRRFLVFIYSLSYLFTTWRVFWATSFGCGAQGCT